MEINTCNYIKCSRNYNGKWWCVYAIRELEELYGDIEDELSAIVNSFGVFDVPVDVNVKYWGDYNGMYIVRNGVLVDLDENEVAVIESDDNDLIKELENRGYTITKANK